MSEQNYTFVIAGSWREFDYWCKFEADPPLNPALANRKGIVALVEFTAHTAMKGRHWKDGDKIVYTGEWYQNKYIPMIHEILLSIGCPKELLNL